MNIHIPKVCVFLVASLLTATNLQAAETVGRKNGGNASRTVEPSLSELSSTQALARARDASRDSCASFVSPTGDLGKNGKATMDALEGLPDLAFLTSDSAAKKEGLSRLCPSFSKMNVEQRKAFWVWALGSLASRETQCGKHTRLPKAGTATTELVNMFGLASLKKVAPHCENSMIDEAGAIKCELSLIRKYLLRDERGLLLDKDSPITTHSNGRAYKFWVDDAQKFPLCP